MERAGYAANACQKSSSCTRCQNGWVGTRRTSRCKCRSGRDGRGGRGPDGAGAEMRRRRRLRLRVAQEAAQATRRAGGRSETRRPGLALVWACGVVAHPSRWRWVLAAERAGRGCNGGVGVFWRRASLWARHSQTRSGEGRSCWWGRGRRRWRRWGERWAHVLVERRDADRASRQTLGALSFRYRPTRWLGT
jgi:hypothetical protein